MSTIILCFALLLVVAQTAVLAAPYGEGSYGDGVYNSGSTPSSSTGSSGSRPPGCEARPPDSVPDLFQINAHKESLTLFFTPSSGNRDRYFVSYGTEVGVAQHGFEFMNSENGVISVEVKALQPNTVYYFKVRAGNGCQPGEWSNELSAKTGQRFPTYRWSSLPQIIATGVTRRINPASVTNIEADASTMTPSSTPSTTPTAKPDTDTTQKPQASTQPSPTPTNDAQAKQNDGGWWQWLLSLFKGS